MCSSVIEYCLLFTSCGPCYSTASHKNKRQRIKGKDIYWEGRGRGGRKRGREGRAEFGRGEVRETDGRWHKKWDGLVGRLSRSIGGMEAGSKPKSAESADRDWVGELV